MTWLAKRLRQKLIKRFLYSRAVGDTELASLYANHLFILSPNGFEVKQFFHTQSEAIKVGNFFIKGVMNKLYFHTVEVVISDSLYGALDHHAYEPGIEPIVTVPMGLLPAFNFEVNTYGGFK